MKVNPDDLRIGELAERTGVSAHRLRRYEEHGLLASRRDANGYRVFEARAAIEVARIVTLLHAGLNLDEVAQVLPRLDADAHADVDSPPDDRARLDPASARVLRARQALLDAHISCLLSAKRALDRILDTDAVGPTPADELCGTRLQRFNSTRPAGRVEAAARR